MLFVLIFCGVVSAADVGNNTTGLADTPWPKFQGDINNTGQSDYNGPQTNTTEWTYDTDGASTSQTSNTVIGADGTIYFGLKSSKYLYALYPNGNLKWKCPTASPVYSLVIGANGIIYGATAGSPGRCIYAFDPNGNVKWIYDAGGAVRSLAIGNNGVLYFGSQTITTPMQFRLNALEDIGDNYKEKWTFYTSDNTGYIYGVPAIGADGTIYFGSNDQYFYALNPSDGSLKWKYKTDGAIQNAPAIGADGTIYVGSGDGKVYAFSPVQDPANPQPKWTSNKLDITITNSAPSIANDGTVYIGTAGTSPSGNPKVYALIYNGSEVIQKWSYSTGGLYRAQLLLEQMELFILEAMTVIYMH